MLAGNQITISCGVDLLMDNISCPASGTRGSNINVTSGAKNNDQNSPWASPNVALFLSTDSNVSASDICLGARFLGNVSSGRIDTVTYPFRIPANIASGTYYIGAIVDSARVQPEEDENNNNLCGNTIVIQ